MCDHHEDAVRTAFYYDRNKQESCDYYIVCLCDECTAERGGGVGPTGATPPS